MNEEWEGIRRDLGRELADLSARLVQGVGAARGAAEFGAWLSRAAILGGGWQEELGTRARVLEDRVGSGFPAGDALDRLVRLFMEASDRLEIREVPETSRPR